VTEPARLTVVGSGTLLPSAVRRSASLHLELPRSATGAVRAILLDCGAGTLHGLAACGLDWEAIDVVAITHGHPDHVSDLVPLLAAFRFRERERPLVVTGPADVADLLERFAAVYGTWVMEPGFALDVQAIGPDGSWRDPDGAVELRTHPVPHRGGSIAYVAEGSWGRLGYTGDTGPSPSLGSFLAGCDVLVAECALADPPAVAGHLSPALLAELASAARPDLLLVTHVYPPRSPEEAVSDVRAQYEGRVEASRDGLRVDLAPSGPDGPAVDPSAGAG
jgi:ribonuclease BN (tRNA processing enzyme)